jgi:hypothetical protein
MSAIWQNETQRDAFITWIHLTPGSAGNSKLMFAYAVWRIKLT